jgi:hypothetical protein
MIMSRPIVVLGMHRGGTSLVGDLLHRWGAYAGDERQLLAADKNNLQGYWEYKPLINFNQNLLDSIGANWSVPPGGEEVKMIEDKASESSYRQNAEQLVAEMRAGGRPWFWKDPRLTILLPFWKKIWGDAIYVITVRHPLEIAMSLRKRDRLPLSASLLIWQQYMLECLRHTESSQHKIFIEYEKLNQSPFEQCQRLCSFLDQSCPAQSRDSQVVEKMAEAVNISLRHNRSSVPFSESRQATPEQKTLYALLSQRAQDRAEPFEQTEVALYPGWKEYLQTFAALSTLWQQFQGREQVILSLISKTRREVFGL